MKTHIRTVPAAFLLLILVAAAWLMLDKHRQVGASIDGDASYNSTTTVAADASATVIRELREGAGMFGSVIIASSSALTTYPSMVVYDATSTMATSTARVLAKFGGGNQEHGTYTFDSSFAYGLSIEMPTGFTGGYTVTWK